ncbi:MAG: hypothetical protein O7C59_06920, partial [Rickettsia endosymbiont of Ixodes persulcatus]|nr:hypothetical protein [Rickettsia endosymbiont of Ixodes persulcatus]
MDGNYVEQEHRQGQGQKGDGKNAQQHPSAVSAANAFGNISVIHESQKKANKSLQSAMLQDSLISAYTGGGKKTRKQKKDKFLDFEEDNAENAQDQDPVVLLPQAPELKKSNVSVNGAHGGLMEANDRDFDDHDDDDSGDDEAAEGGAPILPQNGRSVKPPNKYERAKQAKLQKKALKVQGSEDRKQKKHDFERRFEAEQHYQQQQKNFVPQPLQKQHSQQQQFQHHTSQSQSVHPHQQPQQQQLQVHHQQHQQAQHQSRPHQQPQERYVTKRQQQLLDQQQL